MHAVITASSAATAGAGDADVAVGGGDFAAGASDDYAIIGRTGA